MSGEVFQHVDIMPSYKGGMDLFYKFLQRTIRYPASDRERSITGKVYIKFVVEKDGSITNLKAEGSPSKSLADEALRTLKLSGPWVPGPVGGAVVRSIFAVPINFTLATQ